MENTTAKRASSRNRPPSRPTTPLRPSSRTSLRESQTFTPGAGTSAAFPLDSLEPAFAELSDSMADLEANFMHLQLMHESLSRFNENFASFLYGLNMNAFCVDFPEAPIPESFRRARGGDEGTSGDRKPRVPTDYSDAISATSGSVENSRGRAGTEAPAEQDPEASFLTTDTSFFDKPASAKKSSKNAPSTSSTSRPSSALNKRGTNAATSSRAGRGHGRGTRASGIARGKPRGAR
ncbi:MAG: hypothetical protein L6R40_002265 [Gallowayella cf. fulva]|nr:MAG: hypothetical protein L6R40_002265 [Xanthomendoza cf. fulva]